MATPEQQRAESVRRYLSTLGVRTTPSRRAPTHGIDIDDDIDAIGAEPQRVEPPPVPRETVVDEIEIIGDPDAREGVAEMGEMTVEPPSIQSQGVRNVTAALPEFLSEPFDRATRDPNSIVGRVARSVIDAPLANRVQDDGTLDEDPITIGALFDDDAVEAVQTFGERGADALPLGFGDELYASAMGPRYTQPRQQDRARTPGLEAQPLESDRDRYRRERSERSARHPVAAGAGTIAGGLPVAALLPAARSASVVGRVGQAAGMNAGLGFVQGAGLSEGEMDTDEGRALLAEDALTGMGYGAAFGGGGQIVGETIGALRNLPAHLRNFAARSVELNEGGEAADAVRRLLAPDDAAAVADDVVDSIGAGAAEPPPRSPPPRPRPPPRPFDDLPTLDEPPPYVPPRLDAPDELGAGAPPAPRRPAPRHPAQGPSLRAAAERGEALGSGRAADDLSVQAVDEMTAQARDYADIESRSGGFQQLKDRRIADALAVEPPPEGWQQRAQQMITATRRRLDLITRHMGAADQLHRPVGQARMSLERAESLLRAGDEFGRPTSPAEIYRELNRANMGIGQAASREARSAGDGMQHTTTYADPLQNAYQDMRGFLADPDAWGSTAAGVQAEMNSAIAPLIRDGRALREQLGPLFVDSNESVAGDAFRARQIARPEPLRRTFARATDDAYRPEREAMRSWVDNYADQGETLARLADDPSLQSRAAGMQERAQRLLDILDRAEVEGASAEMLRRVQELPTHTIPGLPAPRVGTIVRLLRRIETGDVPAVAMRSIDLARWLDDVAERLTPAARIARDATRLQTPARDAAGASERARSAAEFDAVTADTRPHPAGAQVDLYDEIEGVEYDDAPTDTPPASGQGDLYDEIEGVEYDDAPQQRRRRR